MNSQPKKELGEYFGEIDERRAANAVIPEKPTSSNKTIHISVIVYVLITAVANVSFLILSSISPWSNIFVDFEWIHFLITELSSLSLMGIALFLFNEIGGILFLIGLLYVFVGIPLLAFFKKRRAVFISVTVVCVADIIASFLIAGFSSLLSLNFPGIFLTIIFLAIRILGVVLTYLDYARNE